MSLTRRDLLAGMGATAALGASGVGGVAAPVRSRPNVLLVMVDDLGFSDLGAYGSEIRTPHLDRLAADGMTATGYTTNIRCSPTRASLLTGRYPTQAGVGFMAQDLGHPEYQGHLNARSRTYGAVLGDRGYQSSYVGKWHVGHHRRNGVVPATRGFESSYGPVNGFTSYYDPVMYRDRRIVGKPRRDGFYLTDALAAEAERSIRSHARGRLPWTVTVSFTAPHAPLHAPADEVARYRRTYRRGWDEVREQRLAAVRRRGLLPAGQAPQPRDPRVPRWSSLGPRERALQAERMAVYAAQVSAVDRGVGRLLRTLDQLGLAQRTVVIFCSDNGAARERLRGNGSQQMPGGPRSWQSYGPWATVSSVPFAGVKGDPTEGAMASPLLLRWPGTVPPASRTDAHLHCMDVLPTLAELAGVPGRGPAGARWEGRSFASLLAPRPTPPAGVRRVCWEHEGQRAVRVGRMKLVGWQGRRWQLYDLGADRAEQRDLARDRPALTAELGEAWHDWARRVRVRRWTPRRGYGALYR